MRLPGELCRAVFDDHDGRVGHLADRDGQPGQRKEVDGLAKGRERQCREQRPEQQYTHRRDGRADVLQRHGDHEDDDDQLVDEGLEEIGQRVPDQGRAVVGRNHLDPSGKRAFELLELLEQGSCYRQHVPALLHDRDPAHDLAGAVEIGDAASKVVADLDVPDVLQLHRLPVLVTAQNEELELVHAAWSDAAAQLVFPVGHLDGAPARLLKRTLDGGDHLPQRDRPRAQKRRKQLDLILRFKATHRRHLGNPGCRLQRRLDQALVQLAQFTQIAQPFAIDQRVLKNPAHAAGIGADRHVRIGRQLRPDRVQAVCQELPDRYPAGRILQDHVDERVPHMGGTAERLNVW